MVRYSHLFKNFPVCCDLHSQRLYVVSETEVDDELHEKQNNHKRLSGKDTTECVV